MVFESSGGRIFRGVVFEKSQDDTNAYIVKPDGNVHTVDGERNYQVLQSFSPKMLKDLQIEDFCVGMSVLVTWQELPDGFV